MCTLWTRAIAPATHDCTLCSLWRPKVARRMQEGWILAQACFVVSMTAKAHTRVVTVGGIESTHGWGHGMLPTKVKPAKSKIVRVYNI